MLVFIRYLLAHKLHLPQIRNSYIGINMMLLVLWTNGGAHLTSITLYNSIGAAYLNNETYINYLLAIGIVVHRIQFIIIIIYV